MWNEIVVPNICLIIYNGWNDFYLKPVAQQKKYQVTGFKYVIGIAFVYSMHGSFPSCH
jgi:hypothetical protein